MSQMCFYRTSESTPFSALIAHTRPNGAVTMVTMFTEWVAQGLQKPGKDQYGLADALGVERTAISKLINGKRQLKADEIEKVAAYIEEPPPDRQMELRYFIGAGQEVFAFDTPETHEWIPVSGMWGVDCELAEVRGDSMWPMLSDGDRIFIGPARAPRQSDHNKRRVVRIADGRQLVKVMRRTTDEAIWDLESFNGPPISGVVIVAVAPIIRIDMQG